MAMNRKNKLHAGQQLHYKFDLCVCCGRKLDGEPRSMILADENWQQTIVPGICNCPGAAWCELCNRCPEHCDCERLKLFPGEDGLV